MIINTLFFREVEWRSKKEDAAAYGCAFFSGKRIPRRMVGDVANMW
jgi:hypothetical protein